MSGSPANWKTNEDYVETAARGGSIRTRGKWADFQLHLEWATPNPAHGDGQGRGNSGILINNMYEVQVLDSYQAKTYPDGQAGAIYGQQPPLVNASKAPGEWQSFDITFRAPRFDAPSSDGSRKKTANAVFVKVLHNGKVIHENVECTGPTRGAKFPSEAPTCPILLQGDHGPVAYRNFKLTPQ